LPGNGKLATALEALQLCLKLLPPGRRDELRTLLTFMGLAAEPQGMKLDKEVKQMKTNVLTCFLRGACFQSCTPCFLPVI